MLRYVEGLSAHTPRPEGEPKSELPEEAKVALRKTLAEVLVNDLAVKEKERAKKDPARAKKG